MHISAVASLCVTGAKKDTKYVSLLVLASSRRKKILLNSFLTFRLLETDPIKKCLVTISDSTQQLAHLLYSRFPLESSSKAAFKTQHCYKEQSIIIVPCMLSNCITVIITILFQTIMKVY